MVSKDISESYYIRIQSQSGPIALQEEGILEYFVMGSETNGRGVWGLRWHSAEGMIRWAISAQS